MNHLAPHANESIFSWVVRYHLMCSVGHEKNTYQTLFQQPKTRIHPYLPQSLVGLAEHGELTPHQWLVNHTLFPLFHFFGHDAKQKLSSAMLHGTSNAVITANIPHARLNFSAGHRVCPLCFSEFRDKTGVPMFDIRQQIPGLVACPIHHCLLVVVPSGDVGLDRQLSFSHPSFTPHIYRVEHQLTIDFAQFCWDSLALIKDKPCDLALLHAHYRHQLMQRGFMTRSGQIRMARLVHAISECYQDMVFDLDSEFDFGERFLGPLVRNKTRTLNHPFKHLILGFWLFDKDPRGFLGQESPFQLMPSFNAPTEVNDDRERILSLLSDGVSMSQIETKIGRSRCYIRRIAELAGIKHASNANAFSQAKRHWVLLLAQLGRDRHDISKCVGVGLGYVEQLISNTPGLVQWRQQLNAMRKHQSSVIELLDARQSHPEWRRKELKSHHSRAFFHLYHHDRDCLEAILPPALKPLRQLKDWEAEDARLVLAISELEGAESMSLTVLASKVRDKGHLIKRLDKLPLTLALLVKLGLK
ncbi:TnsD family Tn7-like transposition protein [Shewanella sp. UCD-KL21]|uniref:TnsD family Tn7-like transposition protein n=1 Tax=Shewanella sp. UCD-KL21 TaxID=1917164 RepID=UPI00097090A6|nr:TnsD family Tn7-like transposition protein [Shewanella sp. UCD-KL21]